MTPGDPATYRALPSRQRRTVRRAARRGSRAQFEPGLAEALLGFTGRRRARAGRALVLAVVLIVASAVAVAVVLLRYGPGPLLAAPVGGLFVGGVLGVVSERRLRRAEEAGALAEHQVRRRAGGPARGTGPGDPAPSVAGTVPPDAARERLARILSGTQVVRPEQERTGHPWD